MVEIAEDVAALLESGDVAIWIATANIEGVPQTTRSMGARAQRAPGKVWLFLPRDQSQRVLANARGGARLAATFVRIHDYRAIQVKGVIASTRLCGDEDQLWPARYRERFATANERVGMPRELIMSLTYWPCVVVEVDVRELYAQTPGPNAGAKL